MSLLRRAFFAIFFTFPAVQPAHGQKFQYSNEPTGSPQDSFLYANFNRAHDVLDSGIMAFCGNHQLNSFDSFSANFDGQYYNQAHYERPWAHHEYKVKGTLLYCKPLGALLRQQTYDYNRPLECFTLLGRDRGLSLGAGNSQAEAIDAEEFEDTWREELEIFPQEFLRQALDNAQSLRWLGEDEHGPVIQYQMEDGSSRALFFDSSTSLLRRMEHIDHWKLKGDRLEWIDFSQYKSIAGFQVAHKIVSHWERRDTQSDESLEFTSVQVSRSIEASEFAIPAAFAGDHEPFLPEAIAIQDFAPLPFHDLGQGVHIIDVQEANARAMLVEFADFSVIIEGGDHSALSERILKTAEAIHPQKAVRYVAMSHHHPLYTGGIRTYANHGVTILSTAGNVEYIRELTTRPYRMHPDAQQRAPRAAKFEVIDKVKVIEDGTQRLELHNFDSSLHTDEYVLTYVPALKLGFLGDIIYSPKEGTVGPGRGRTQAVHDLIKGLELDIQQLSQTCNLSRGKMLYPFSEIEASALATQPTGQ